MSADNLNTLTGFLAVARERSFTRAASELGVSQPALSKTVRSLEANLGLRLLTRTTRRVALTEAGERLLRSVGPHIEDIQRELTLIGELREKPTGTVRLTATEYAAQSVLWPAIRKLLPDHPGIKVEVLVDYGLTDIVGERIDAGVRPGGMIDKDMIATPISPPMRMAVVGSPAYFERRLRPKVPQDLTAHNCINLRLPTHRGVYVWEFEKRGRTLKVRVDGQLTFNTGPLMLTAALEGFGLVYLNEGNVKAHLADGRLIRVLQDWCEPFLGYHLYYPSRRQPTPAFALLVEKLRYKERRKS